MIKGVVFNDETGRVRIVCDRDRLRRTVLDVPSGGHPSEVLRCRGNRFPNGRGGA